MTTIPIASFLAGSLLTLLLPIGMFLALAGWYLWFVRRVPETPDVREPVEAATPDGAASKVDL
jgi:hypothetical protein